MIDPESRTRQVHGGAAHGLTLLGVGGPAAGTRAVLDLQDTLTVGRAPNCSLQVEGDQALSRHHFGVMAEAGIFVLSDAGSVNGTAVNGRRVSGRIALRDRDRIEAGASVFEVRLDHLPPGKASGRGGAELSQHRVRCRGCGRVLTMERATVLVESAGPSLELPADVEFFCRACRQGAEGREPEFPGYRTLERIGEGNMGAIFLVERRRTGGRFALKHLRPNGDLSESDINRFLREAASLSALNHPNIVSFVDQGYLDGEFFFVMEYVEGVDLDLYRRQAGGRVAPDRCITLMGLVLDGLDYAHRQGFVHRDVKPANILVGVSDGAMAPKLTDFGLAKQYREAATDPITRGHISFGTPDYMPPEQITAFKSIGPLSDLYSVGAALYHLLSGQTLYQGVGDEDPIRTLLRYDPPPLGERAPWLAAGLTQAVDRALERDPSARWRSAAAFRDALYRNR